MKKRKRIYRIGDRTAGMSLMCGSRVREIWVYGDDDAYEFPGIYRQICAIELGWA